MKKVKLYFLLLMLVSTLSAFFSSCEEEPEMKTSGRINAEKIESLLGNGGMKPQATIYLNDGVVMYNVSFLVEDQFLHVKSKEDNPYDLYLDLNHLVSIEVLNGSFRFRFSNYK